MPAGCRRRVRVEVGPARSPDLARPEKVCHGSLGRTGDEEREAQLGRLTTHVLDTAHGRPAAGLNLALFRLEEGGRRTLLTERKTNADGRCDGPLLEGASFGAGVYELVFAAAEYFRHMGLTLSDPPFLGDVVIRFGLSEVAHYHVPLLLSPYGYSTYRGS